MGAEDSHPDNSAIVPPPDRAAVLGALDRVLATRGFSGSARMCRFLRFAVEYTLAGRAGELKEYLLGTEIFDRDTSFDPRVDPIVRVEARRLRAKLKAYYETEGAADPLIIQLPVGTYAPRFLVREAGSPPAAPGAPRSSIAVLPFANLSPLPDSEYFSDGLTEELIHALTKIEGLRVVAWNSTARLKDRQHDFLAVGRELRVGSVLSGSVRQSAGRLRVMARLVDTASSEYLWSETFDREPEDLFAIQEEISAAIARSLRMQLLGPAPPKRHATDIRAYDLYLRGRFHWNKRTHEGLRLAIALFEQAIAADASFAAAHAGLADAHTLSAEYAAALPEDAMQKAKAAALRALELDPSLAEPHASLALIASLYEWNWTEAERRYRRAIELNPSYVTAHYWYSLDYLALRGRFEEAQAELDAALRLDPLSQLVNEGSGYLLLLQRRYDEALDSLCRAVYLDPGFYKFYTAMGRVYIHKGMYAEAVGMLNKGRSLAGGLPSILGALGQACALGGREAEARAYLGELSEMARVRYVPSSTFALIHCGLGETARALDWLEFACRRRETPLTAIKVHPAYDDLRTEPRFQELIRKIALAD